MKALITGITVGKSRNASATLIYRIFDKYKDCDTHINIIDDLTDGNWAIDKRDVIFIEDEIPNIEYNSKCYICSEEYFNDVSEKFLQDFTLNSYNKLVGKEYISDEDFYIKYYSIKKDNIFDWKKIIKDFFGDRVDIQNEYFIVHFPKKHVENSSGRQHTIYDVYLKITINYSNSSRMYYGHYFNEYFDKYLQNCYANPCFLLTSGTRTTASKEEHISSYCFSHFQRGFGEWRNTCLGEGLLRKYGSIPISNEELAVGYCVALENYLSWESLEGGPYIKISDIRSNIERENLNSSLFSSRIMKSLISNKFNNLILNLDTNKVYINENVLDEVNSFYAINGDYISLDKLNQNDKNNSNHKEIVGNNFFTFNGKETGKLTIDYSLNKSSSETIFSGELDVYRMHYSSLEQSLTNKINSIINDKSNNFLEKKPLFRIN